MWAKEDAAGTIVSIIVSAITAIIVNVIFLH